LLSRTQIYVLKSHTKEQLVGLIDNCIAKDEYLKAKDIIIKDYDALLKYSGGDARKLCNILELVTNFAEKGTPFEVTNELVAEKIQQNIATYDKGGEQHYDIASALIKSIRGSDPNGAVYWLARMIEGGEDVKFIARRIIIAASEDIGLANPNALLMATTAFQAVQAVGMPEGRIILSQAVVYLATSPKSNASYLAIKNAQKEVRESGSLPVPLHLRNAPTKLMKDLDYGKDYQYSHDYPNNFVEQEYLPDELKGKSFYKTGDNAQERKAKERMEFFWKDRYGF